MNWQEVCICVLNKDAEIAEAICNMAVSAGIYIEDYSDLEQGAWEIAHVDLIDEDLLNKDRQKTVIHLYLADNENPEDVLSNLFSNLDLAGIKYTFTSNTVNAVNWENNWKKYFKVKEIGNRLAVCPNWEEYNGGRNVVLKIDPGAAFGTGTHATTSLCLEMLDEFVESGKTVLDIGCGSGILAIASVLLGASAATGVDIDPVAVRIAGENAVLNGVQNKTDFFAGDLAEKVNGKFNIITANIVADVIIRLLKDVKNYMLQDSILIVSGIIDIRVNELHAAFKNTGFAIIKECKTDNWYAFALKISEVADA